MAGGRWFVCESGCEGYWAWGIRVLSESGPVRGAGRGRVSRKRDVCLCLSQRVTKRTRTNEREQLPNEKRANISKETRKHAVEQMEWNAKENKRNPISS